MAATTPAPQPEGALTLDAVLRLLLADQIIAPMHVEQVRVAGRGGREDRHPFLRIAEMGWQSQTKPGYPITVERLSRWLAGRVGLPYLRIDPLKIDVRAVTRLVSQAYASRFRFLPIAVDEQSVTVATAEP
ncbi:MAG: type II/IV secretion system protein, partial [Gammaproteobacteria bacterium]|nr:type II/IV secretion system protein [Gammaproteobacteria bacterium]